MTKKIPALKRPGIFLVTTRLFRRRRTRIKHVFTRYKTRNSFATAGLLQ